MKFNLQSILFGVSKALKITSKSLPLIKTSNKEIKDLTKLVNKFVNKNKVNKKIVTKNNNYPVFFK